ncbi:MAG: peptidyl-prolyl cis-trans isomerase, partial [Deltaproteobacteria bacterium]|nr:peptidyl-prolyl cis-trans isomerase [Deltaproteobacteria bacterium]
MNLVWRLLREPLFQFLVGGGLLFALYTAQSDDAPGPANEIVLGADRIELLAKGFEAAWRRPPSDDERRALIDDHIREEIYYREALALGLDRNDTIIRRRLRQKMEFFSDVGADLLTPAPGELEAHYLVREEAFRHGPQLAFEQLYLGEAPESGTIERSLRAFQSNAVADEEISSL